MTTTFLLLLSGLTVLTLGAEFLVRGSALLAMKLGVPALVVGLTVVALGTSSPELAVSIQASINGNSAISLGNVLGSNIANLGLVLGIAVIIQPIKIERDLVREQIPILIFCSALLCVVVIDGKIGLFDGSVLITGLVAFLYYSYRKAITSTDAQMDEDAALGVPSSKEQLWHSPVYILIGMGMLIGGSILFVGNAIVLAKLFNVSEAMIALTIVALGTSVPELATSIVAALKKEGDIAIGNAVGSNLFNILAVLGVSSLISPISSDDFSRGDFAWMLVYAMVLLPFALSDFSLTRREGAILLLGYATYMGSLVLL